MPKIDLKDIIVILPGILGSVLQKDSIDLWAISGQAFGELVKQRGQFLQQLRLKEDDPELEYLEDGIRATHLVADAHLIPGFWKIDGYTTLVELIRDRFQVKEGNIRDEQPANFFLFPYDWRRDNRVNAKILQKHLEQRLKQWRDYTGSKDAKVIILAHSMGGLIARYYVEVLEGWPNCKALFTFGTPFRGSVNAVNFLANGLQRSFWGLINVDLTFGSTFTSIYQLLPIYKMLQVGDDYQRIAEATITLSNIDREKARDALKFHREIEEAVNRHKENPVYLQSYKTIPIVGIQQTTLQSVKFNNGLLKSSSAMPEWIESWLQDGDGTVPYLSAVPIELSNEMRETYIAQKHSSIQNDSRTLQQILTRIQQMQSNWQNIRGPEIQEQPEERAAINLLLEDIYLASELVIVSVRMIGDDDRTTQVKAKITPVSGVGETQRVSFQKCETEWKLEITDLPAGLYRIEVSAIVAERPAPHPVQDLFEVIE